MSFGKILRRLLPVVFIFLIVVGGASVSWGKKPSWKKPPWSGGPGSPHDEPPPVTAPEPTALSLIVMGAFGVAGYFFVKKSRKK